MLGRSCWPAALDGGRIEARRGRGLIRVNAGDAVRRSLACWQ